MLAGGGGADQAESDGNGPRGKRVVRKHGLWAVESSAEKFCGKVGRNKGLKGRMGCGVVWFG